MSWKFALQNYIKEPTHYENEVLLFDDKVVIVKDQFPKSTHHLLILTRDLSKTKCDPTTGLTYALKDELQPYVEMAQDYIYQNFTKRYKLSGAGSFFENEDEFLDKDTFIETFIQVGVHSVPSMANMHIHVVTKDFNSVKLKNKKHYNSFTTNFFIHWDMLPLEEVPNRKETEQKYLKNHDLVSVYNGKSFGNKFSMLKQHLSDQFEDNFTQR